MTPIMEKLYDATARIESVIFMAGAMAATDAFPDDLNDFFDDEDVETIEKLFGKMPDWVDLEGRGYERAEGIFEWLKESKKFGFLVKFATPVMTPSGPNSRSFSWGYYSTQWFYEESIEAAIEKGLAWCEERRAKEDAKAKKGGE
jgi:hypothetical protein